MTYTIDDIRQAIASAFPGPLRRPIEDEIIRNLPSTSSSKQSGTTSQAEKTTSSTTTRPAGVKGVLEYIIVENLRNGNIASDVADYWSSLIGKKATLNKLTVKNHLTPLQSQLGIEGTFKKKADKVKSITEKIEEMVGQASSSTLKEEENKDEGEASNEEESEGSSSSPKPSPERKTPSPSKKGKEEKEDEGKEVIETITLPSRKTYNKIEGDVEGVILIIDPQESSKNIVGKFVDGEVQIAKGKTDLSAGERKKQLSLKDRKSAIESINNHLKSSSSSFPRKEDEGTVEFTDEKISQVAADFATTFEANLEQK